MIKNPHIQENSVNLTSCMMLAMEHDDKERNKLTLVKHHNTKSFCKTHFLIVPMHKVCRQRKKETGYFWSIQLRPFRKTHRLILSMEQAGN